MVRTPGLPANESSSEPSGPRVGPEMSPTSRSGLSPRPRTEATVFSCAPPRMSRVMMCVTRMRPGSIAAGLQVADPLLDDSAFRDATWGGLEVLLVVADCFHPGSFESITLAEAVIDMVGVRQEGFDRAVIGQGRIEAGGVGLDNHELRRVEVDDRTVEEGGGVIGPDLKRPIEVRQRRLVLARADLHRGQVHQRVEAFRLDLQPLFGDFSGLVELLAVNVNVEEGIEGVVLTRILLLGIEQNLLRAGKIAFAEPGPGFSSNQVKLVLQSEGRGRTGAQFLDEFQRPV